MAIAADLEFWIRLAWISGLNLLLSGDNALVIALAVRTLPRHQRMLGQVWGALGAVALRLAFVGIVSALLRISGLQFLGGVMLVWIAVKLVQPGGDDPSSVRHGASLWEAIWIIIVADVTMSLDNVLAIAAAARGEYVLIVLGIGLSLPIVVWGAGLLARLMNQHAWIVWTGGGLLGYAAAEMALEDPFVRARLGDLAATLRYPVPVAIGIAVTAAGWWMRRTNRPDGSGEPLAS